MAEAITEKSSLSISKQREATLSYSDQTIPYGAKPTITVDGLLAEDKLTDYKVSYSNYGAAPLLSSIQQGSIVIQNEKGEDRTACYHFTYPEKEATLTITKRKIGLTFASVTKDYDGKAITTKDYQVTSGSFLLEREIGYLSAKTTLLP